jgi:hypothetical protein
LGLGEVGLGLGGRLGLGLGGGWGWARGGGWAWDSAARWARLVDGSHTVPAADDGDAAGVRELG